MANQYGTKVWARWANNNIEFALSLLKEPDKLWDEQMTYKESAIKSLNIIRTELEEVLKKVK